jgi:HTH-type transcriptional regulator/antitoxin HigA
MTMTDNLNFETGWTSAPGDTVMDILEERGMTLSAFAQQMNIPLEQIDQLITGRNPITAEIAQKLQAVLGASDTFWLSRESKYREDEMRFAREISSEIGTEWLKELPIKDLTDFGWLKPTNAKLDSIKACLSFFGEKSISGWRDSYREILENVAFKTSPTFQSRPGALASWLRRGELNADEICCENWDAERFRAVLTNIRLLTRKKNTDEFLPELERLCASCGVALVVLKAPTGCRASGATRFISPTKATILLSNRYLSEDHFWFAFFHEAAHLILHDRSELFVEWEGMLSNKYEQEANEFAARLLIPSEVLTEMFDLPVNGIAVIRFARKVGVSPGIVVGQLQYHGRIRQNQLNNLKRRFVWAEDGRILNREKL